MNGNMKVQYSTALPYPRPTWPILTPDTEATALSLLLTLLTPIGEHRLRTKVSRGRNRAKRKRDTDTFSLERTEKNASTEEPEIFKHVTVGLANNYRTLEAWEKNRRRSQSVNGFGGLSILFCCRAAIPEPAQDSLLLLIAIASRNIGLLGDENQPILLVPISEKTEKAIAASLGIPRASLIGIKQGSPGTQPLEGFLRETVQTVQVPWLQSKPPSGYLPLKTQTTVLPVKDKVSLPVTSMDTRS